MKKNFIYELFKRSPLKFNIPQIDKKLKFVEYEYRSKDITAASIAVFAIFFCLTVIAVPISTFFVYLFIFSGVILSIAIYIYPTSIVYSQRLMEYSEEMLKALMRISTFILMNQSIEYAILNTKDQLRGTLRTQFEDIADRLRLRKQNTLGEVFEYYTPIWNSYNPDFVKALRLLETATMSPEDEKKEIIDETLQTLIISYHTAGKRFAENLASNAKTLIAFGVLFPIISLMLLPLVSVFLPNIINPTLLIFVYNVFFPATILLMALNFSSRRIQVDTIDLKESPEHKRVPLIIYIICIAIIVLFFAPALIHLLTINTSMIATIEREYELWSVIKIWFFPLGIAIAIWVFNNYYHVKNKRLWNEVDETERDVPHLLQSISTYLTLNMSFEKIIPATINDYEVHGFGKHPTVKFFKILKHKLYVTKKSIAELTKTVLPKICPSKKVTSILSQIISFTNISQRSAAEASKMIRKQTILIYELDDYIKTMLSETVALIGVTINFLAPILCAAAVLMSLAIVKALTFISRTLESIQTAFGGDVTALQLVKITEIIPPTVIELIVAIYLIELTVVLSLFLTNIKVGNDNFQLAKTLKANLLGFALFSIILIIGHYVIVGLLFPGFQAM